MFLSQNFPFSAEQNKILTDNLYKITYEAFRTECSSCRKLRLCAHKIWCASLKKNLQKYFTGRCWVRIGGSGCVRGVVLLRGGGRPLGVRRGAGRAVQRVTHGHVPGGLSRSLWLSSSLGLRLLRRMVSHGTVALQLYNTCITFKITSFDL